jgi:hypothetical protein
MGDPVELSFDGVGCSAAASSMRTGLGGDFGGVVIELDLARQPDVVSCRFPRMTR